MKIFRRLGLVAVLAWTLVPEAVLADTKSDFDATMSHDGLKQISIKGIGIAYAKPGATLAGYNRVQIEPVQVAFRKDWDPTRTGSRIKLTAEDRENIRISVATLVQEEFVKALESKSSYKVVNAAGADVLRVKINILNLYVNAPDTQSGGRSRTFTVSAGEMTMFAELFDSESGEPLARIVDRREGRNTGMMQLSDRVENTGQARDIASSWARILRNGLDKAHGIGKK
jgi:Protein of unknown function (DUF3313)